MRIDAEARRALEELAAKMRHGAAVYRSGMGPGGPVGYDTAAAAIDGLLSRCSRIEESQEPEDELPENLDLPPKRRTATGVVVARRKAEFRP